MTNNNEGDKHQGSLSLSKESENDVSDGKKRKKFVFPHFGIFCGLLSSMCFSMNALFAKMLSPMHPVQIAASRCYLQYIVLLPYLLHTKKLGGIIGSSEVRPYLWLRGLLGSMAGMLFYLSVGYLSAGNAVTLSFLDIVMMPLFGWIFLKESMTIVDYIFAATAFSGVILIAQPSFLFPTAAAGQEENALGVICGVSAAVLAAASYLVIRKIGKQANYLNIIFYYALIGSVLETIILSATQQFEFPCLHQIPYIILMTVAGHFGQVTLILALRRERGGTVSVLLSLQIIFVYFVQTVILHDIPSSLTLGGASLVFLTSIGIAIRKLIKDRKKNQRV